MAEESEIISYWSELPNCLLDLISSMLTLDADFIRFGCVCTSWRSVFLENIGSRRSRRHPPMLLIPLVADSNCSKDDDYNVKNKEEYEKEHKDTMNKRSVYNLKEEKVCEFRLPVPDNTYCIGSSFGWLVTVPMYDENYPVKLLNPFLPTDMNEIELPSLHTLPPGPRHHPVEWFWYMTKAVLSANPTTESDYAVMAIYGEYARLAFWKPGDSKWTSIGNEKHEWTSDSEKHTLFQDVIFHRGQFYAINQSGFVFVACDINGAYPKLRKFSKPPSLAAGTCTTKYIIESSSGNLFQVHRSVQLEADRKYETVGFQVFKLLNSSSSCHDQIDDKDDEEEESKWLERQWTEVHSLDGNLFFIGNNASVASDSLCVSTECYTNCIYFTDDYREAYLLNLSNGPHDMEVYDLEDETFQPHYCWEEGDTCYSSLWPNPIWVEPPFGWEPSVLCRGRSGRKKFIS